MKKKLIVVTDLGTFKAYRLIDDTFSSSPRLELIKETDVLNGDANLVGRLTDQAGQFSRGTQLAAANNNMANGERHNIALEQNRRVMKNIAQQMQKLAQSEENDGIYFAASKEINQQLLQEMPSTIRNKIEKNIGFNLVNAPKAEILSHFEHQPA